VTREPSAPVPGVCLPTAYIATMRRWTLYDMYPDWGPAQHHPENPLSTEAVQAALDLRDNGGQRPDDN